MAVAFGTYFLLVLVGTTVQGGFGPALPVIGMLFSMAVVALAACSGVGAALALGETVSSSSSIGLVRPSGRWLLVGAGAGLSAFVSFWILALYARATGSLPPLQQSFLEAARQGTALQFTLLVVLGGLLAPFGEELLFRGMLYTSLRHWGPVVAVAASSLLFGVLHGADPVFLVHAALMGVLLALLYELSGSLWPGVIAHGLHNALLLGLMRLLG